MLDENEFLSPYGIRALSRYHASILTSSTSAGQEYRVAYLPAESDTGMFGGNSNWRGPIWMPVNALIIRALLQYYVYYGDDFKIECPTGSGNMMNLFEVAEEIAPQTGVASSCATRRPAAGLRRRRKVPERSALAGSTCCSTNTSTATTAPGLARAIRPAGLVWSQRLIQLFGGLTDKDWLESGMVFGVTQEKVSPKSVQQEQPPKVNA